MKYLLTFILVFGIATPAMAVDLSKCTKKIEKVGDNHIIISYVLYDAKDKEVVIQTEEYGHNKITEEKEIAQAEYDKWNAMDTKEIDKKKAEAQAKLDKVNALQVEMDKTVITE